jgi:hypothetical protein
MRKAADEERPPPSKFWPVRAPLWLAPLLRKTGQCTGCVCVFGARWGYTCVDVGQISGRRWPATWSSRTLSEPISISSARSLRMTALAITSRPLASAPTADAAIASGPMADGPRTPVPTALAPVVLAPVVAAPVPAVSLRIASAVPHRRQRRGSRHFGGGRFLTGNIGRLRILGQTRGHLVGGGGKRRLSRQKVRFRSPQVIE